MTKKNAEFLSFSEARKLVQSKGFKTVAEFQQFAGRIARAEDLGQAVSDGKSPQVRSDSK